MATGTDVDNAVRGLAHRVARIEKALGLTTDDTLTDLTADEVAAFRLERMAATGGVLPADDPVEKAHKAKQATKNG